MGSISMSRFLSSSVAFISLLLPLVFSSQSVARADEFVSIQGDQFVLDGQVYKLKGTNYYPRNHMWADMWTFHTWEWGTKVNDAELMRDFGLNCVRILVPYNNNQWGGPNVKEQRLQQLEDLVILFGEHGIRSCITLFDWETSFPAARTTKEAEHLMYLSTIVNRLKDNPYVFMWDVKNEPDHPSNIGGGDYWDSNPPKRDQIASWITRMCNAIRTIDPNHPVSAGMRWAYNLPEIIDAVDIAIFHAYWSIDSMTDAVKGYMGSNQKPILIQEFGWPTEGDGHSPHLFNESYALGVYQLIMDTWDDENLAGGLQWMTHDAMIYDQNAHFENFFGIWKFDGSLKPSSIHYRDNFPVNHFPTVAPFAPPPVDFFAATRIGTDVHLYWENPSSHRRAGTMARFRTDTYPTSMTDGELVCDMVGAPDYPSECVHSGLQPGTTYYYSLFSYTDDLTVAEPTQRVVTIVVDADLDNDGDCDQQDFARLQRCKSGPGIAQDDPACADALLDGDNDVDIDDVSLLNACRSGPGQPLPAGCVSY
jgi:hypothetical protein